MKTKVKNLNRLQKDKDKEKRPSAPDYHNYEDKQRSRSKKKWNRKDFE
ncbi:MAG: hypothetical protein AMQ22_01662 [Candidatus Methanofastidiosum methylothiophilum]|uniref:Uncharacterized protein n=1 Tax=Candidatus Methanofastidiosum methylothiophilum TaxID=1705564 RepID=A0A150IWJ4_9EURY|nr:MAG: hypothetical protein AMQ22_01662 [Candidatus Methanofastidiosum methylthiophilus]